MIQNYEEFTNKGLLQKVTIKDGYGRELKSIMEIDRIKDINLGCTSTVNAAYEAQCQHVCGNILTCLLWK